VKADQGRLLRRFDEMKLRGLDPAVDDARADAGQRGEAEKILAQLLAETKQPDKHVSSYNIAKIYAGLGQLEQAFVWLDKAYAARDSNLSNVKVDPQFDSLRADTRIAELLRRMGLTP
jgi:tetratricopeptide (TPR) repeat protein